MFQKEMWLKKALDLMEFRSFCAFFSGSRNQPRTLPQSMVRVCFRVISHPQALIYLHGYFGHDLFYWDWFFLVAITRWWLDLI